MAERLSFIAHVKRNNDGDWSTPHYLDAHLREVAELAAAIAPTALSDWARLAGRWHDLGKYRPPFQDYLRKASGYDAENAHIEQAPGRVSHSIAGARYAITALGKGLGHILAYAISGHHAGLPNGRGDAGSLYNRLTTGDDEYQQAREQAIPADILQAIPVSLPPLSEENIALWLRMLFSCLVDADFLDTERYMSPENAARREKTASLTLASLQPRYQSHMHTLAGRNPQSPLHQLRQSILDETRQAAALAPGLFSLTVPTGGGKTLASLGFALDHALRHGKKRIIYAIPYTSIIEQNAAVFRQALGEEAVIEHHCNLDNSDDARARLACENWDAPVIVTTNVQLFESLHAARPSRCRKLHNLADSVIILDEAQQLPRDFHAPITQVMQQLTELFGVSWVLCTATQPVLEAQRNPFGQLLMPGLTQVREIIARPTQLADSLRRVEVRFSLTPCDWQTLATDLAAQAGVLCIVNTRADARTLYRLLADDPDVLHLSAQMCAEHRSQVIAEIKQRLAARQQGDNRPLRVISTQLVEAGVDLDFPTVWRAIAGLDAIAQAAGRCNREGQLTRPGIVQVFMPPALPPAGALRQAAQCTLEMVNAGLLSDPLSPAAFRDYFTRFNSKGERDRHGIGRLLRAEPDSEIGLAICFRDAAEKFRLIDDAGVAVIVPWQPDGEEPSPVEYWLQCLESDAGAHWVYRKLQRYSVTLPQTLAVRLQALGALQPRAGLLVLVDSHYCRNTGVKLPEALLSAEDSVI
ncbi:CRISPR-associated endonuclease Cas3'' [Dickeya dianthicola]|uniref:CRISPR-associated endonuclease Cas3'' n=1 Tax=Dickeya dianthicola TaxID=204039 RepID=UPI001BDDE8A1|nr:CRISPR-associated endonuclease Cas3'' [Dickeya dianthicola]MBT1427542.1 CRISPR-associated endonuclease Cas3'' [Dickeya dianthicola]MBT1459057.1 CRISPR-associated endonuclease Cas3'' [Dickeya dianthicola]MBT1488253.1 CRISPR-associated endonuclease Cas3'' [Dickeya dianthicola]